MIDGINTGDKAAVYWRRDSGTDNLGGSNYTVVVGENYEGSQTSTLKIAGIAVDVNAVYYCKAGFGIFSSTQMDVKVFGECSFNQQSSP